MRGIRSAGTAGEPAGLAGVSTKEGFPTKEVHSGLASVHSAPQPASQVSIHWSLSNLSHLPEASGVSAATPAQEKSIMAFVGPLFWVPLPRRLPCVPRRARLVAALSARASCGPLPPSYHVRRRP